MFSIGTVGPPPPPPHAPTNVYNGQALSGPLNIPDSPPRLARRAPRKGNKRETLSDIARRVPVEVIRPYFNYPLRKAAEALSISVTTLKRLCRRHGVKRWPHRQLSGLNRAVSHLEAKRLATKDGSSDSVISDQLHQLYSRREIVIDLAFMSDDEAAARGGDSMKMEFMGSGGAPPMASGVHTMPSPGGGGMSDSFGNPYGDPGVLPWWHREPGAPPVMGMSSFGAGRGGGGGGGGIGVGGVSGDGFNDAFTFSAHMGGGGSRNQHEGGGGGIEGGRSSSRGGGVRLDERRSEYACQTSTRDVHRHMNGGGGGGGAGADAGSVSHDGIGSSSMPNFRTSSGLVRLPGLMSPAAGNMEGQPGLGGRGLKLPSPGSILAGIPGANAARVGSGCATPSGGVEDPPRRPISPMTIGPSQRVQGGMSNGGTGGGGGGVIKRPPHFLPLPQHHPSDSIEKQIAELTALNDILFGPDQEDAHALLLHQQQQLQLQQQQLRQQHQHAHEHGHAHVISSPPGGSRGGGIERGGTVDGPKGVFAPPNSNAPDRIARSNGGGHHRFDGGVVDGGDGGVEGEGGGGRLPSIAGLVAAGALLSGEKPGSRWRSCRQGETMLVRGRTGEV